MTGLDAKLADLHASPDITRLIREVSTSRGVDSDRRSNYVSIRPAPIGAIAVYAHAGKISIATAPELADASARGLPAATLVKATPATTYVVVPSDTVGSHYDEIVGRALAAVDWRASGPGRTLGDDGRARRPEPEICPNGWMPITPAGTCMCECPD